MRRKQSRPPVFDLILSRGRIADRTPGAIPGAALTAAALAPRVGGLRSDIGTPEPPADDDWRVSLPAARETLAGLRAAISASLERGHVPLMVANTCSASLASLPVVAAMRADAVILWIDAHGDFNTPATTGSGYLGGMALAAACGLWDSGCGAGLRPERVILIGARDIDPEERALLRRAGVRIVPPAEADPETVLRMTGGAPVWLHVDWDALEPGHAPAAYSVPDGLPPERIRAIFAALPPERIAGLELAEFEATGDETKDGEALAVILDTVGPLFAARQAPAPTPPAASPAGSCR